MPDLGPLLNREARVCAAALLLAGCGESQAMTGWPRPAVPEIVKSVGQGRSTAMRGPLSAGRELLTVTPKHGSIRCRVSHYLELTLHAKGDAFGPFPGTFIATGSASLLGPYKKFNGTFVITSGGQMISGTMQGDLQTYVCPYLSSAKGFTYVTGSRTRKAVMTMGKRRFALMLRDL